jgi:hypothetical protein
LGDFGVLVAAVLAGFLSAAVFCAAGLRPAGVGAEARVDAAEEAAIAFGAVPFAGSFAGALAFVDGFLPGVTPEAEPERLVFCVSGLRGEGLLSAI